MKKRITLTTIVLAALFAIVCFAVRYEQNRKSAYEQNQKSEYEEWLDAYMKCVEEELLKEENLYCIQHGGDFSDAEAEAEALRALFLEEVAANISLTEQMGLTYEEFLAKMEKLDETYNNSNYFSTNAEVMYEAAIEGGYRETLIPSIICLETAGATRMKGENNSWNAIERRNPFEYTETYEEWRRGIKFLDFDSSEDAISTLSRGLKETLLTGTTLKDFAKTWDLSVDSAAYAIHIYQQMQKIEDL